MPEPLRKLWSKPDENSSQREVIHIINNVNATGGAEKLVLDLIRNSKSYSASVISIGSTSDRDRQFFYRQMRRAKVVLHILIAVVSRFLNRNKTLPLLHIHLFPGLYLFSIMPGPRIYTIHSTNNRRRKIAFLKYVERWIFRSYDNVVGVSDDVKASTEHWVLDDSLDVKVVENGIETSRFLPGQASTVNAGLVIGMAARFSAQKDQATIVRALPALSSKTEVRFAGDGPTLDAVRELAASLGVSSKIKFLGDVKNMPEFYAGLDVYVQSSFFEGQPLAVMEAMASGLPVISNDTGGVPSLLQDAELLFATGDETALASRILKFANEPDLRKVTGARLQKRSEAFDISRTVAEYEAIYDEICDRNFRKH